MRNSWDSLITLVAIAAAVVVPVRLAFALDHPVVGVNGLRLVQLLFLVDAILQCRSHLRRDVRSSQAERVVRGAG